MRHSRDMFGTESYHGNGIKHVSGVSLVTWILTIFSIAAAIYTVGNFNEITARIAILMSKLFTSGFLIIIAIIVMCCFVMKMKWKTRRRYWI